MPETAKYKYVSPEALAKLGRLNLVAKAVVEGFVTGLHRSPYHGFSVEFAEHRQYVAGDDPKYLDWLALGRTDRYYIKRFQEETNLRAYLLIDASSSMAFKSDGAISKLEYGCYLAASLAFLMVRQQDSVGLTTFSENVDTFLPPRSTTVHLNLLLRRLEQIQLAEGTKTNLSASFHTLAERIKKRGMIIIISDLLDDRREVMRGLSHFRHKRHEVLLFHVMDRNELEFPYHRLSDFVDMETGQTLQVDPVYVRNEYQRQLTEFINGYKRDCAMLNIDYVLTDTSVPYDFMLFSYLSKRLQLG
jgi:uncharacterized protein (DUF58 family)